MSTTSVKLPGYFQECDGSHYFSVGSQIYGSLSIKGSAVTYIFCNGQRSYEESRSFRSESAAARFAARFAAEMRRADSRNAVPHMGAFRLQDA
jgi:hypothetical protein